MRNLLCVLSCVLLAAAAASAKVVTRTIEYTHNGVTLQGYFAFDDAVAGPRPGVLLVHEWWGHNKFVQQKAEELAAQGYAAFALDMYGKGVLVTKPDEAGKLATPFYTDRTLMRDRAAAGLKVLAEQKEVVAAPGKPKQLGSMGFCFGGTVSIELARAGASVVPAGSELSGVISFHGGLAAGKGFEAKKDQTKAAILICHGADDPMVPDAQVKEFTEEMKAAGADVQVISYSGTVHSFTNPDADKVNIPGVKFNASSAKRAWEAMKSFWAERLKSA
jgi:dienelactone hydrolase